MVACSQGDPATGPTGAGLAVVLVAGILEAVRPRQCLYQCVDINTLMPVKTVTLAEDAYAALAAMKRRGESFSDVIRRIARTNRSLLEFAGAWKDVPKEKMRRYLAFLEASDELSREKMGRLVRPRKG